MQTDFSLIPKQKTIISGRINLYYISFQISQKRMESRALFCSEKLEDTTVHLIAVLTLHPHQDRCFVADSSTLPTGRVALTVMSLMKIY